MGPRMFEQLFIAIDLEAWHSQRANLDEPIFESRVRVLSQREFDRGRESYHVANR
jgi:hypothetical protein